MTGVQTCALPISLEENKLHVKLLFERLREYGITINISKSAFGLSEINFLGYLVTPLGVKPLPSRVQDIVNFKEPETVNGLRRFLGMINFYRRFIPDAAEHQAKLHALHSGNKKNDNKRIQWNEELKATFKMCKEKLANATLLSYPILNASTSLWVDASDTGMGGVLQQQVDGEWKPIAFYSKKLSQTQIRYSAYDRELLAAYSALKHFQYFLEGREFAIYTDHKPLIYAFKQKPEKASPRQLRHLDYIGQHTVDIRHIPGKENVVADTLSRLDSITMPSSVDYNLLANEQENDGELKSLIQSQETSLQLKRLKIPGSEVEIFCDVSSKNIRPFITSSFRKNIFNNLHGLSHPGIAATVELLKSRFVWPSISKDAREWTRSCIVCKKMDASYTT